MLTLRIDLGGKWRYFSDLAERMGQYDPPVTPSELADEAGYHRSAVSRWLNEPDAHENVKLSNVIRLEKALAALVRGRRRRRRGVSEVATITYG